MQKITTCLFFDGKAQDAVDFYKSVFKNFKINQTSHYGDHGPMAKGSVMTVIFEIDGQKFMALNGPPIFKFSPAISLMVNCETQQEIDHYWDSLSAGGSTQQCGWLTDKFGVSWQIVPPILGEYLNDADDEKSGCVMQAMLKMDKLNIKKLKQAYEG